ncbi:MAG: UDP-N-acetylglucosamine--N-acetylmuramyl-(pentapeptide) pyrophosphoryl-undecaprenol N-acetylglucosamine transferase [Candidatus Dojkabacteria bacterium]|jgi:UDP-N-acetylglucosamine--N-acetylmuramyl-(pentapeptide) pyrophosphoryl-undecaprenol N-acetylglucosamine transferase|nr:UDP-N-acetylglucosamine--N-acetylmuramyl-(pentapeptide) pyrophosphoryl-undecaprenol N-acetylglucosamine transferase [Candidatus Dojkabacteria bacterium]
MLKSEIKILITGGGSGGHISVAKSLISTLIEDFDIPSNNLTYVGGDLGMEGESVGNSLDMRSFKDVNVNKYYIRAGKFQRKVSLRTIPLLFRTILGFFDSISILSKQKPNILISTGGFVSVPVCIAGILFNKPIYLHEQTASVGLSNRVIGRFAKKIYLAFRESSRYFKEKKVVHVGNIVRKEIFLKQKNENTDIDIVKLVENNSSLPFIYISGGSLGSHVLNEKVIGCIEDLLSSYRVLLQTGDNEIHKDFDKAIDKKISLSEDLQSRFVIKKYIDEKSIGYVLNSMDLFVGRSGANTVYEIGVLKKYALLIPIPWVTHNEQYLNAKVLEDIGSTNILEEKYLENCNLRKEIERLEEKKKIRKIDSEKLEKLFPINAAHRMLTDILKSI